MDTQWRVEIPLKYVYSPAWFSRLETRISVLTSPNVNMILFNKYTHTCTHTCIIICTLNTFVHVYILILVIHTWTLRLYVSIIILLL